MTSWRDPILAHFTPEIASAARLTIVADPDQLLGEPGIVEGIRERGFEIITFDDHVRFRYAYEQRFRRLWDSGEKTTLVVVLRAERPDLDALPFDLLQEARRNSRLLSFSLGDLFPNLQPQVLGELDRSDLDAVHVAVVNHSPGDLGTNATREFLLRHVFEVAPELIKSPSDLLRVLLRRHYGARVFPPSIDTHFISLLEKSGRWDQWPLDTIVANRAAFLQFLHERWPLFLRKNADVRTQQIHDGAIDDDLVIPGPRDLPFDHDDVRVYIDNLFIEGILEPTTAVPKSSVTGTWMAVGVRGDVELDEKNRWRKLMESIEQESLDERLDHRQWIQIAHRWAETVALRWSTSSTFDDAETGRFTRTHERIERAFDQWMQSHYASLSTITPWPRPVMVHHVPGFLAHGMSASDRHALVVVDGLSLDQWSVIRPELRGLSMDEDGLFAWVPTLTTVSRQAIFAGEPPFYFAPSIESTYKEPTHWARFWEDRRLRKVEVGYACQKDREDDDAFYARVLELADNTRIRALAVVVGTIDQMLHGVVTGTDGLHAGVRHWAQRASLLRLVTMLLDAGYAVSLTADHGNVEGRGIGKPNVGATAEQRGERAHVFRDALLRGTVATKFEGTISWAPIGLPENYLPLIAPAGQVFINEGKRTVAHGGICIEEVIVPFIRFRGSNDDS